jgi:hypothetical protein
VAARERKGKEKGKVGKGRERKGKEGKGKEWLEPDGEKKPLGMSELGCADGCGRRGCKGLLKFEKYSLPKFLLSEIKCLSETLFFDILFL